MQKHKKLRWVNINRIIILLIFIVLSSIAFYFTFKESQQLNKKSLSSTYSNNPANVELLTHFQQLNHEYKDNNNLEDVTCLKEEYFNQIHWINQIRYNFITGKEILPTISIHSSFIIQDNIIQENIKKLLSILDHNPVYNLTDIHAEYKKLRFKVSKQFYSTKFSNSTLVQWLLSVVNIHLQGDAAIQAGEPSAALEEASRYLNIGHIENAYEAILPLNEQYHSIVSSWLEYTKNYIEVRNIVMNIHARINSNLYKNNFTKNCQ